jgi:diguanylate cyclase (GGDEF)-like protein
VFDRLLLLIEQRWEDELELSLSVLSRLSEEINGMMLRIKRQEDTNKWLTGISQQDSLTNLANRRGFDEKLFLEWNKARLSKNNLSIIMIDVDFFKQYNDYYGHVAGDKCLQTLANVLASQLSRSSDFLARYGGEEFVCVLPDTNEDEALKMCNAMLASVSALNMVHEDSAVDNYVSISLGCLTVNGKHSIDVDTLLQQVDKRLYQAKSAGRNQISSATYR